jgi:NAD(P)-dependent dehydrogenase (short-subunit alcohol dehydrogenase family)
VTLPLAGKVALVTGGSRGVGAATVEALARAGAHVVVNYRNKARRAEEVADAARALGVQATAVGADITEPADVARMIAAVGSEFGRLDVLVLNASGGMERDLVAADPAYPMRINRDAPVGLVEAARPLMPPGGVIVHVTSHLAHFYGRVEQIPVYEPVAESKHAGERALLAMAPALAGAGLRLAIVSGDLIEDTIVPRLMDRRSPGLIERRRAEAGTLPTTADMADAIVRAAADGGLAMGALLFVGEADLPLRA